MKIIDRLKGLITRKGQTNLDLAGNSHLRLSTRGGTVAISSDFSIHYTVADDRPCWLSTPIVGTRLTLTLIQSPSGSGKTTLLRELYSHIQRHGGASKLRFDFHPDYTEETRIACGFIPQHPPLVKHWRCDSLLPKSPRFFGVFFPEFDEAELKKLPSKRVGQLSGGQVKRLLACSALEELCSTDQAHLTFLLLDETFDGIGAPALVESLGELRSRWLQLAAKPLHLLLVTHLSLTEMRASLANGDLAVTMSVQSRSGDELTTILGNEQC